VLVAPQWIDRVSWAESKVFVGLSRAAIKQSPKYTDQSLIDRDFETRLYGHYSRHGYWVDESALGHVGLPLIRPAEENGGGPQNPAPLRPIK